jgi:hypothetical protein
MIDIAIEYQYLFFFRRKATGQLPTSWSELSERQFIAISKVINGAAPDRHFLALLTGVKNKLIGLLSPYELKVVTDGIDFISTAGNSHFNFFIRQIKGTKFTSPRIKLDAMTFGQFIFADAHYNDWMATKKEDSLNHFVSYLYLLPGENFDKERCKNRIEEVAAIPIDTRKAIAFNYGLVMVWLQKAYPLIFQETKEERKTKPLNTSGQSPWVKIFESLVGDDLINADRWAILPLHNIFRYMTDKFKENLKRK